MLHPNYVSKEATQANVNAIVTEIQPEGIHEMAADKDKIRTWYCSNSAKGRRTSPHSSISIIVLLTKS